MRIVLVVLTTLAVLDQNKYDSSWVVVLVVGGWVDEWIRMVLVVVQKVQLHNNTNDAMTKLTFFTIQLSLILSTCTGRERDTPRTRTHVPS
jgi:hypothetical protein